MIISQYYQHMHTLKNQTIKIETCVKRTTMKTNQFVPNVRDKTTNQTRSELFFFWLFSEDSNKQNKLVNNN